MRTLDGGQTWQPQNVGKNSEITRILFTGSQEGWLTGVKYLENPRRSFHLMLHTTDQGQNWIDVSSELNRVAAAVQRKHWIDASGKPPDAIEGSEDFVNDLITDIVSKGPLSATILTADRQVYRTDDGGQHWQILMNDGPDYLSWSISNRIGLDEGKRLWVTIGADSSRGVFGRLKVAQGSSWTQYTLPDVFFWDGSFLPENRILACGYQPSDASRPTELTQGVILYSNDRGNTWTSIYSNPTIDAIRSLATVSPDNVWAVGNKGLILHLTPAEDRPINLAGHPRRRIRR